MEQFTAVVDSSSLYLLFKNHNENSVFQRKWDLWYRHNFEITVTIFFFIFVADFQMSFKNKCFCRSPMKKIHKLYEKKITIVVKKKKKTWQIFL